MSAWTVIAHTELSSGTATSITFSSIAGTYTDLCLVLSAKTGEAATYSVPTFTFNSNTSAIYSYRFLYGNGSSALSASVTNGTNGGFHYAAGFGTVNTFGSGYLYIPNYAGSSNKSWSIDATSENNDTGSNMAIHAGIWANTAAITSITLDKGAGAYFEQYTSATLYGITKGSSGGVTVS